MIFGLLLFVVFLYVMLYILLSAPGVQRVISQKITYALSEFLGARVDVGELDIMPFNEIIVNDLVLYTPEGEECLRIGKVGAGISLSSLLIDRQIDITYAEILNLEGRLWQAQEDEPWNIDFLIKAFAPKKKKEEKTKFDLEIRNIVMRRCAVSIDRLWIPESSDTSQIDFNHVKIANLRADLSFPRLSDTEIIYKLRRMSLSINPDLEINKISANGSLSADSINLNDFLLVMGSTRIFPENIVIPLNGQTLRESISRNGIRFILKDNKICPKDFSCFFSPLNNFSGIFNLNLEASTDLKEFVIEKFQIDSTHEFEIMISGNMVLQESGHPQSAELEQFNFKISNIFLNKVLREFPNIPSNISTKIPVFLPSTGNLEISASALSPDLSGLAHGELLLKTEDCNFELKAELSDKFNKLKAESFLAVTSLGNILNNKDLGELEMTLEFDGDLNGLKKDEISGLLSADVGKFICQGKDLSGILLEIDKKKSHLQGFISIDNQFVKTDIEYGAELSDIFAGNLNCNLYDLDLDLLNAKGKFKNKHLSAGITVDASGNALENLTGSLEIHDLSLNSNNNSVLKCNSIDISLADSEEDVGERNLTLSCDYLDAEFSGKFTPKDIISSSKDILASVFPSLINASPFESDTFTNLEMSAIVKPDNTLTEFFNLPFRLLVPIEFSASLSEVYKKLECSLNIPYLQQGRDKLIYDTRLSLEFDGLERDMRLRFDSNLPAKNGDVGLAIDLRGEEDILKSEVRWESLENPLFRGVFSFDTNFFRNPLSTKPDIDVKINPSRLSMGTEDWNIAPAVLNYADNSLSVSGFKVWHDNQFVEISGIASDSPADSLTVSLSQIDVDYVFDTLKINYVTFGGEATGTIKGSGLFSKSPIAQTEKLIIKDLSYNGCVIGDGDISSHWDNEESSVAIAAIISKEGHQRVDGSGGVWLKADSLCFDIAADKVPVGFIQPFMQAFSSDIGGFASGKVRLAGNFHDIDLVGTAFADSVNVKLDYTQTYYHGSDSVLLHPGRIEIPGFKLYDKFGNSAVMSGELTHKYFHDPVFTFKLSDADNLLCYDTTSADNPDWYGTVFGSGSALIQGWPGYVDIGIDMSLLGNSTFTFVLNETQAAAEYNFLSFTDKRKEEQKKILSDTVVDFKTLFRKRQTDSQLSATAFDLDVRARVTPSVLFTIVMDPRAGDKITARGSGAIQVEYNSPDDRMSMFGKYTIDEGNYNFSLQDLILRDFKIVPGSFIVFNGNPLDADLDISAAYRVNTNLSDLDKSFSTDRDLARTNVPVDAILKVDGHMTRPNITFDIDLPTLTSDVKRKVKSIISTDDMMNRQVIYLLALNRFYTPEYMGNSGSGGELSSIASSTISSQLSNMLGQLTDKFTVSPSFRSYKGDFSDLEFDIALSSRLLNNRLLLNGNFGYRDKTTSSTTFIGDFDLEYLLNKNGNFRLKAYNHFNDQNYYLREALTTQGLGVIYRRDFDNPFSFLKHHGKKPEKKDPEPLENNYEEIEETIESNY